MTTKRFVWSTASLAAFLGFAVGAAAVALPQPAPQPGGSQPHTDDAPDDASLVGEIRELRAQVRRLEDALRPSGTQGGTGGMSREMGGMSGEMGGMSGEMGGRSGGMGRMSGDTGGMSGGMMGRGMMTDTGGMASGRGGGMAGMMKMGGMSGGEMSGGEMSGGGMPGGGMPGGGMPGKELTDDAVEMMGMMGMGSMDPKRMTGTSRMKAASALPGFPGASHIYHVGATGFFLDHPEHLTLTADQQAKLNGFKRKALLDKATAQREIDEAEQQLWELTAADEPDVERIRAKIEEIATRRAEQRLAFIRAVGEAAAVLTEEQRKALLGTAGSVPHTPDSHSTAQ